MINKILLKTSVTNFGANISTRQLLEFAENDVSVGTNGKPRTEILRRDKFDRVSRYKKKYGDRIYEIYRTCKRKIKRFANEALAEKAARAAKRRYGIPFSTYHCPVCQQWHLCKAVNRYKESWH